MHHTAQEKPHNKVTSLLSFIFFFSGFAALMYQVAWQRLLTVHYGVGTISITIIVSVFMFGMGLGALYGGYLAERVKNLFTLYFIVELLIGCFGLISIPFLDYLGRHTAGSSYMVSFFYMFLFLSLPTLLMGITLPLLTKIFNRIIHNFITTVSFLYFINTIGAAIGAVISSYVIISFFGLDSAVYFAVIINFMLAALIYIVKYFDVHGREQKEEPVPETHYTKDVSFGSFAYLLVFITGFLAIGYEIIWFRVVGVLVKSSPYAFSSVLSVYLCGIAIGSIMMHRYLQTHGNIDKKGLFYLLQFLIGIYVLAVFIGYYYLTKYTFLSTFTVNSFSQDLHPLFRMPSLTSIRSFRWDTFLILDVFLWPIFFIMVPTILMGASFPLISFLALKRSDREASTIGTTYFFNIAGNVLGGIVTGFILLRYLGTEMTLLGFALVGVLFGLCISKLTGDKLGIGRRTGVVMICIVLALIFFPKKGELYDTMHISPGNEYKSYFEEGIDGIIMTYNIGDKMKNYINGLSHGYRPGPGYYRLAVETLSCAPKVDHVLIIGYGLGSITEAVAKNDAVKKITIVEINRDLMENLEKMETFRELLSDRRIELVIEDARRLLLRTDDKYDVVLMDPLRTTTSYSNNIYSAQFFELVKDHMNPGGIFNIYIEEHNVLPKTVLHVFEYIRAYRNFFLASTMPIKLNSERREKHIANFPEQTRAEMAKIHSKDTYSGNQDDIRKIGSHYPINQDWKPVNEYYLGSRIRELFIDEKETD